MRKYNAFASSDSKEMRTVMKYILHDIEIIPLGCGTVASCLSFLLRRYVLTCFKYSRFEYFNTQDLISENDFLSNH